LKQDQVEKQRLSLKQNCINPLKQRFDHRNSQWCWESKRQRTAIPKNSHQSHEEVNKEKKREHNI